MTKMTANNNWIPYIHKITRHDSALNINFGNLLVPIPFVTHSFGYYGRVEFEFSESTLNYLLNELKMWSAELNG